MTASHGRDSVQRSRSSERKITPLNKTSSAKGGHNARRKDPSQRHAHKIKIIAYFIKAQDRYQFAFRHYEEKCRKKNSRSGQGLLLRKPVRMSVFPLARTYQTNSALPIRSPRMIYNDLPKPSIKNNGASKTIEKNSRPKKNRMYLNERSMAMR